MNKLTEQQKRQKRLRFRKQKKYQVNGTTGTIPEPMMWDVARKYQLACLATDAGISDHVFKSDS